MRRRLLVSLLLVATVACSGGDATDTTAPAATTSTTIPVASSTTGDTTTTTRAATSPTQDLGRTARVTASSQEAAHPAVAAIDGDPDTWWGAGDFPPQWIELDFGAEVTITELSLTVSQDPAGPTTHRVLLDGEQVAAAGQVTADQDVIRVGGDEPWEHVTRLRIETTESPSWVGWREVTVRGRVTGAAGPPPEAADVIFNGGPILTMSDAGTVEAIAVTGDTITAVGSEADVLALAGPDTRIIDLDGRTLMPGFVDPHTHLLNDAGHLGLDTMGGQQLALENGITTFANMYTTPEFLDEMRRYEADGELRARISLYLIATDNCGNPQGDWWLEVPPTRSRGEMLRIAGTKLFLDGGTCGDWATSEPIQPGGGAIDPFLTTEQVVDILDKANAGGYQVVMHSIGDLATLRAIDAIEATTDPSNPLRHRIDHITMVTDEVIDRFGDSGAVGVLFGWYPSCAEFDVTDFFAANARRHPELMAANPGSHFAWHGDDPWVGPISPLQELHNMVTRVGIADDGSECDPPAYLADRTFDVMTALRMMTIDAAYALDRETEVGSLEVGKYADLIVLTGDPSTVAPREIYDIGVIMTMVGGSVEVCVDPTVCPA